jgi:hypothetical protein
MIRVAAAKFLARFADLGAAQDEALLSGLLQRQGVRAVPVSDNLRQEFYEAAHQTRDNLAPQLLEEKRVPATRLLEVMGWLADFRAADRSRR